MKRHVVLLAEERSTIEGLLTRAVRDKLNDGDEFRVARKEDELWQVLNDSVTVLLLSSTFSSSSHNEFIETVLEKYPNLYIISLNNRFGDRSPLEHGAFEIVDKPVRNPVLWAKMDKAFETFEEEVQDLNETIRVIEDVEEEISFELEEEETVTFDVEKTEEYKDLKESNELLHVKQSDITEAEEIVLPPLKNTYPIPRMKEDAIEVSPDEEKESQLDSEKMDKSISEPPPIPSVSNRESSPALVIDDGDDEDDDDDLFGIPSTKQRTSPTRTPPPLIEDEDVVSLVSPIQEKVKQDLVEIENNRLEKELKELELDESKEEWVLMDEEETIELSPDVQNEVEVEEQTIPFELEAEEDEKIEEEKGFEEQEPTVEIDEAKVEVPIWKRLQLTKATRILPPKPIVQIEKEVPKSKEIHEEQEAVTIENIEFEVEEVETKPEPNIVPVRENPLPRTQKEDIKQPSDTLEQEKEIFSETDRYDEKSEWIEANEGFVAKNGEFVSLAPPRARLQKVEESGTNKARKVDNSSGDGGGLFGSVKSLFKK